MNLPRSVCASLVMLVAACHLPAADSKLPARVLSILDVESEDASGYASWIAEYNQIAKAKLGIDGYLRVFQTQIDGQRSGRLRVVVTAKSVAEMMKTAQALENDPAIVQNREHLRAIRQLGGRTLYQAVRFDGTDKGGSIYNTMAVVSDEAGYLKSLEQLRVILDGGGLKDARINVYRILAGRTDHTHLISIGFASSDRLAAFLDFVAMSPQAAEWLASTAKFRTVVSNLTARDISK